MNVNKEPWLAGSLSWIVAGVGHFYIGRYIRGVFFLVLNLCLIILLFWMLLSPSFVMTYPIYIAWATGGLVILIGATWDAVRCAKVSKGLTTVEKRYPNPWFAVFLSLIINALGYAYLKKWIMLALVILLALFAKIVLRKSLYGDMLAFLMNTAVPIHIYIISSKHKRNIVNKPFILFLTLLAFTHFTSFLFAGNGDIWRIAASGSMEPTLKGGDRVIESRIAYWWTSPKVGDIVIIKHPAFYPEKNLAKRVAAVGGETIQIKDGQIIVDGKERKFITEEPVTSKPPYPHTQFFGEAQPYLVPEGSYFLLGDNIYNSSDSRSFGAVTKNEIYSKVIKIIYPTNRARIFLNNG